MLACVDIPTPDSQEGLMKQAKGWGHACKGKWRYLFTDKCKYCGKKRKVDDGTE